MTKKYDVAIVGGGAIGLSIGCKLASAGRSVAVLDAGEPGKGTSWAASGALALIMPDVAPAALRPLALRSRSLWPAFAQELEERGGFSVELIDSGLLRLQFEGEQTSALDATVAWQKEHDVRVDTLESHAIRAFIPIVSEHATRAFHEPHLMQVRTPRLMHALVSNAQSLGVSVIAHEPVLDFIAENGRVRGVKTASDTVFCDEVVLAAGAHVGQLAARSLGLTLPIRPIRGQMLLLEGPPISKSPLLLGNGGRYLVPRADGRILAGSTFENVGFDTRVTVAGMHDILAGAIRLAPTLATAKVVTSWAGLRPESPDRLPYIGRVPGLSGVVIAAGHFRDGILLTPVTAEIVSAIVCGQPMPIDIRPFAPDRKLPDWVA